MQPKGADSPLQCVSLAHSWSGISFTQLGKQVDRQHGSGKYKAVKIQIFTCATLKIQQVQKLLKRHLGLFCAASHDKPPLADWSKNYSMNPLSFILKY